MLATESDRRAGKPQTLGEALGYKADGPLELNTADRATCHACGHEPRLYTHYSPGGREIVIWIPQDHRCTKRQKTPT